MDAARKYAEYMTLEEYEKLPEGERVEIFEDKVFDMAGASSTHQLIVAQLTALFVQYVNNKGGSCKVIPAPFDVMLADDPLTIVQPDLMIICDPEKLDEKCCNGAPDFIVEIVSPGNPSHDYVKKLYYYQEYGVREYWIVDPQRRLVTVFFFEGDIFSKQYDFSSKIKVNIYEDLEIDFSQVPPDDLE